MEKSGRRFEKQYYYQFIRLVKIVMDKLAGEDRDEAGKGKINKEE
jgi:hypothetical protein